MQAGQTHYPKGRIHHGEILVEVKGKAEKVAIVPDDFPTETLVTGTLFKFQVDESQVSPFFLLAYLLSQYGRGFRSRCLTNTLIGFVSKQELYQIPVPLFNEERQAEIAELIKASLTSERRSRESYAEAEALLESVLRLDELDLTPQLFYERPYSDVEAAARLDAEYACVPDLLTVWKPPYEVRPLSDPAITEHVNNGATPAASEYGPEGIPIIKVGDITRHGSAEFGGEYVTPGTKTLKSAKGRVRPGDVMVLAAAHHVRYIGKAGLLETWPDSQEECQAVGELIVVRPGSAVAGEVLMCYLNAPVIRLQVQRLVRGMSAHLYPNDLKSLPVPIVEARIQEQVVSKVRESFDARREARQLLEEAKTMVEKAILGG